MWGEDPHWDGDIKNPDDFEKWFLSGSKGPSSVEDPCPPEKLFRPCNCSDKNGTLKAVGDELQRTRQQLLNVSAHCAQGGDGAMLFHGMVLQPGPRGMIYTEEITEFWELPPSESLVFAAQTSGFLGIALGLLGLLRLLCGHWRLLHGRRRPLLTAWRSEKPSAVVREKLMGFKAGQMRLLVQMACGLLMPITAWSPYLELPYVMQSALVVGLAQSALGLLTLFPGMVSVRSLDAVFCGLAFLVAAAVTPLTCSSEELLPTLLLANCLMLALIAVRRTTEARCPLLLVASLLFGVASCGTILIRGKFAFGERRWPVMAAQSLFVLLITAAAPLLERGSRERVMQLLELQELRELLGASQSLLRSCFDVVVELDTTGCVVSQGRELGALLLRDDARQCLEGTSFLELVEDGETRQTLAQRLAAPSTGAGIAESMQLTMRDACGNSLRMEAMWFGFTRLGDAGSERRCMLGLREGDELRELRQQHELPPARVAVTGRSRSGLQSLSCVSLSVSESSSLQEDCPSSGSSHLDAGAVLVVDGSSSDFPVLRASATFRSRVGRISRGRSLPSVLARRQGFRIWMQQVMDARQAGTPPPRDRDVTFRMPQGNVQTSCRVLPTEQGQEDDLQLRLLFYNISLETDAEERPSPLTNRGTPMGSQRSSLEQPQRDSSPLDPNTGSPEQPHAERPRAERRRRRKAPRSVATSWEELRAEHERFQRRVRAPHMQL